MRFVLPAALVAALLFAAPSFADTAPLASADAQSFAASKAKIEKELADGKTYAELTRTQRENVLDALARIEGALADGEGIEEMALEDKAQLATDQELVNTILTRAKADSRLVCKKETRTGSHRPTMRCVTVAEMRREREASLNTARRHNTRSTIRPPSGAN